jgi:hypothetical protein
MPSICSIVMIAPLLIAILNCSISPIQVNEQRHTNKEVLNKILWAAFHPLTFT